MSVSVNTVATGPDVKIVDIVATADGDTVASITHGLAGTPDEFHITPLSAAGVASDWVLTSVDESGAIVTKQTGSGSGAAPAQVRVTIKRPHSIGR